MAFPLIPVIMAILGQAKGNSQAGAQKAGTLISAVNGIKNSALTAKETSGRTGTEINTTHETRDL